MIQQLFMRISAWAMLGCSGLALVAFHQPALAGSRTIYLIRHGQYDEDDPADPELGRRLTALGREQAERTGERLALLPAKIDQVFASSMTRARETAEIIAATLGKEPVITRDLRECTPPTIREDIMAKEKPADLDSCRMRFDSQFARFFRPTTGADSTVALVCHGNVVRYLAGKSIGLDAKLWLNMSVAHCSIAQVRVRNDGRMQLFALGDTGHLPPAMQTFGGNATRDSTRRRR